MSKNKYKVPRQPAPRPHPKLGQQPERIAFSFVHLDENHDKFGSRHGESNYVCKLLERLKAICAMSVNDLLGNPSMGIRAHRIDFSETSEVGGFTCLNTQLRGKPAYQFSISANQHGRVHGYIVGQIFYVIWLDPCHKLYP